MITEYCIQSVRLSFRSSELGPTPPHPQGNLLLPLWIKGGEWKGPNSDEVTESDTLELYVYYNPKIYESCSLAQCNASPSGVVVKSS
jgi:hypothetical protein